MVELKCPKCKKTFTREKRETHLLKMNKATFCSKQCSGKFWRNIQLNGRTIQVESAISENILREFNSLDNTEETYLQKDP
jgi:endogenous inhibitor of DNA gyrase (YacG/DUF329 family)